MKKSFRGALLILMAVLALFISCSKEEEPAADTPVAEGAPAVMPEVEFAKAYATEMVTDLERFQYSYGWSLMEAIIDSGLIVDGQYFARGAMDCIEITEEPLVAIEEIVNILNTYLETYEGTDERGEYAELEDIILLEKPVGKAQEFAYAYGFYTAFGILREGLEMDDTWFIRGLLDRLYEREGRMTEDEIVNSLNTFIQEQQRKYDEMIAEMRTKNLELAEKMLASKKEAEGNIVVSDMLVLEPVVMQDPAGERAVMGDQVKVNYTLRDIHGNTLDHGDGISFPLSGVIAGFRDACMNMSVGDHVYAYVHPSIGYGPNGTGNIQPNSLLVFEIELLEIIKGE